jgi:S-adenosylmethionine-diacylglycerol 3-amino-3-carboxypropyl transferase
MQSEFYNVALDRIRYSLVWEDSQTLCNSLDINVNDHLLIITSAGCNVLNALLQNPAAITAVDLNPVQNKLLLLKKHIILHHDFNTYMSLLGFAGRKGVSNAKQKLFETLPANEKTFWSVFFDTHPQGLLTSGKLENYITAFYGTLDSGMQQNLHQLITFNDVEEQYDFFIQHLHTSSFQQSFITYFDDKNLSKGRDPKLFKYAAETGGQAFYNRLMQQVRSALVSNNFYFRFFFFGPEHLPEKILPPCYRHENYSSL